MRILLHILLILLLVSFYKTHSQTIVIFKKTKDAIYVAADSRAATTSIGITNREGLVPTYIMSETYNDSSCKISFANNIGMAFLGSHMELSYQCATDACNSSKSVMELLRNYVNAYMPKLRENLERMRLRDPSAFEKIIDPLQNTISEILFFGYNADTPFIKYVYFLRRDPALTPFGSVELIAKGNNVEVDSYCFGKKEQIEDTLKKASVWHKGIVPTINNLAAIAAKANPSTVGGPIDIVKVTRAGRKWIQKKSYCK